MLVVLHLHLCLSPVMLLFPTLSFWASLSIPPGHCQEGRTDGVFSFTHYIFVLLWGSLCFHSWRFHLTSEVTQILFAAHVEDSVDDLVSEEHFDLAGHSEEGFVVSRLFCPQLMMCYLFDSDLLLLFSSEVSLFHCCCRILQSEEARQFSARQQQRVLH